MRVSRLGYSADFAGRKAWSYTNSLDEVRLAEANALARVGAELDPDERIVLDAPATFLKMWPQIREQEDYAEQLRLDLLDEEQRVDELRKKSLRRAHVPIEPLAWIDPVTGVFTSMPRRGSDPSM